MALLDHTPRFSPAAAERLLDELFGIDARVAPLPSERDQNFRVEVDGAGPRFVLKIANGAEDPSVIDAQCALLEHLTRAGSACADICPRPLRSRGGRRWEPVAAAAGGTHPVWLVEFLDGRPFGELPAVGGGLRVDLGRRLAQLDRELAGFDHPAVHRRLDWDLARGRDLVGSRVDLLDAELGGQVRILLERFDRDTAPLLAELPRSVIHNDANDHNVLADPGGGRVAGIVDFGDVLFGFRVGELAIAAAYALLDVPEPLDALADLVAGYARELPLSGVELDAVYGLCCLRLCTSAVMAAANLRARPDDPYLAISQAPIRRTLPKLVDRPFAMAAQVVRGAADPATPHRTVEAGADAALPGLRARHLGPSLRLSYAAPLHLERGFGQFLFGADGRRYLDAYNNVPHVGHGHPAVVAAATRQMRRLNTNTRYHYRALGRYAERLAATLPGPLEVCFLLSSASEANELALRLARAATGGRDVVVMAGAYHGHTTTLIDISPYKHAGPGGAGAPDWVHTVPQPDLYRGQHRAEDPEAAARYAAEAEQVFAGLAAAGRRPAAFLAETCPSVGGQHLLPPGYLPRVYRAARAAGALCIADEVQTGLGRMGDADYAFEEHGVVPDLVVLGKPLGNGHPLAAVVTTRAVAEAFDNGMEFFATFGGNTVSCEVGLAVLDVVEAEGLRAHAARVGAFLIEGLRGLAARHEPVGDVRGRGLFLGVELVLDRERRQPATAPPRRVKNALRARGVLIGTDGLADNVLKIRPPMPFDLADAARLLAELDAALDP
jgi:4-aminobutyrate aminotransferase-like enzyme/Ser/Thr protein kinase RdoA (MazF antagonist)